MPINVKIMEANEGDSILISCLSGNKVFNILVDGGIENSYFGEVGEEIKRILNSEDECIDLLVLTHIDDDHIGGIKALFEDTGINRFLLKEKIKLVWFNSAKIIAEHLECPVDEEIEAREVQLIMDDETHISKSNANTLEKQLRKLGIKLDIITAPQQHPLGESGEIDIKILSPNREALEKLHKHWPPPDDETEISSSQRDYNKSFDELINEKISMSKDNSTANGASIAFLLEFEGKRLLMLGDAHEKVIIDSIGKMGYSEDKKLKVDIVKVPHHASIRNMSPDLLKMLDCKEYIISTDGSRHKLPNKRCLAWIATSREEEVELFFNYDIIHEIFGKSYSAESTKHKFKCTYKNHFSMEDKK